MGLELIGPNAIEKWRADLGAADPALAAPGTLRKEYGESILKNVAHGAATKEDAKKVGNRNCTKFNSLNDVLFYLHNIRT